MSIINQYGQLWEFQAENVRDYDEFQLITEIPQLSKVDQFGKLALTAEGRLFNLKTREYMFDEHAPYKSVDRINIGIVIQGPADRSSEYYIVISTEGVSYCAAIHKTETRIDRSLQEMEFVFGDYNFGQVVYHQGRLINRDGHTIKRSEILNPKEVIEVNHHIVRTTNYLHYISNGNLITVPTPEGYVCSLLTRLKISNGIGNLSTDRLMIIVFCETEDGIKVYRNYHVNGQPVAFERGNLDLVWNGFFYNYVSRVGIVGTYPMMNKRNVISLHLALKDGSVVEVESDLTMKSANVPPHIFKPKINMKNPNTKM